MTTPTPGPGGDPDAVRRRRDAARKAADADGLTRMTIWVQTMTGPENRTIWVPLPPER